MKEDKVLLEYSKIQFLAFYCSARKVSPLICTHKCKVNYCVNSAELISPLILTSLLKTVNPFPQVKKSGGKHRCGASPFNRDTLSAPLSIWEMIGFARTALVLIKVTGCFTCLQVYCHMFQYLKVLEANRTMSTNKGVM